MSVVQKNSPAAKSSDVFDLDDDREFLPSPINSVWSAVDAFGQPTDRAVLELELLAPIQN